MLIAHRSSVKAFIIIDFDFFDVTQKLTTVDIRQMYI